MIFQDSKINTFSKQLGNIIQTCPLVLKEKSNKLFPVINPIVTQSLPMSSNLPKSGSTLGGPGLQSLSRCWGFFVTITDGLQTL